MKRNFATMLIISLIVIIAIVVVSRISAFRNDSSVAGSDASNTGQQPDATTVLVELMEVEREKTEAGIKADKATLERVLAAEYTLDGREQNRAQYIATIEPDDTVESWSISDVQLNGFDDDNAALTGVLTHKGQDYIARYNFTDTFVKRQGRWQVVTSQLTLISRL